MRFAPLVLFLLSSALCALPAAAQEATDCSSGCSDGKVMVAYADGNSTSCVCTEPAEMDPTIPDPNVQEGPVNEGV